MKNPIFFSHLVDSEKLILEIERLLEIETERQEILEMIDSVLRHAIVTKILDELDGKHHEEFVERYTTKPTDRNILVFLREKVPDIEDKLREEAKGVQQKLFDDIKNTK